MCGNARHSAGVHGTLSGWRALLAHDWGWGLTGFDWEELTCVRTLARGRLLLTL